MNDETFTDLVEKANLLDGLFAVSSHLPANTQKLPDLERVSVTMPSIFFRARVLADLNVNKSSGPDGIPALILKQSSLTLACPLAKLFCLSYRAGIFPLCCKLANITPIHKKGETNIPENYRPIAVCFAFSKVMECMINQHLVRYLEFAK